mmetsp:Transcript_20138/g.21885  ORF Transcript_20138/g.21885 Transcript_20138/m.21885 type:complete len:272 (+) Transcript_20138:14-829(+)
MVSMFRQIEGMLNVVRFDLDQRIKEIDLPAIHPPEYYQHEKSKKYPRKRRTINPTFMPELRVMRHDIRRKYGEMLVNVTNNCDIFLLSKFFADFGRPDCDIASITPVGSEVRRNIDLVLFNGQDRENIKIRDFLDIMNTSFQMMPDQVVRLLESQVRVRQGTQGSVVMFKVLAKGSKAFSIYPMQENQTKHKLLCNSFWSSSSSVYSVKDESRENDKNKGRYDYYLEVAPVPLETVAGVVLALVLDANHCVQKLNIEYRCISETPISMIVN